MSSDAATMARRASSDPSYPNRNMRGGCHAG
jgi:hypothetical protein